MFIFYLNFFFKQTAHALCRRSAAGPAPPRYGVYWPGTWCPTRPPLPRGGGGWRPVPGPPRPSGSRAGRAASRCGVFSCLFFSERVGIFYCCYFFYFFIILFQLFLSLLFFYYYYYFFYDTIQVPLKGANRFGFLYVLIYRVFKKNGRETKPL